MRLPKDMRRFGIRTLVGITASFAVSLALYSRSPVYPIGFMIAISVFWLGMGVMLVSDLLDHRPIDNRGLLSWSLNLIGLLLASVSMIGWLGMLVFSVSHFLFSILGRG